MLAEIICRSAKILELDLDTEGAQAIAQRSRGTPRIANNLLRWVRDFIQMRKEGRCDTPSIIEALEMLAIDDKGLDEMDKKILYTIIDHHGGGPVGIKTLAAAIGEEDTTLSEVYEPYLIMLGLIKRTSRGREVTHKAYEHLGRI